MKYVTISYPDNVDISTLVVDTEGMSISDGTVTIPGGTVAFITQGQNPKMVNHVHPQTGNTGSPEPAP